MDVASLRCTGPYGKNAACSEAPRFATWCACSDGAGGTLASALFLFCAEHLAEDLERDPADEVLELEILGLELRFRPLERAAEVDGPLS